MTQFFNRNIPDECHQKMKSYAAAGESPAWVAYAPGGGARWSLVTDKGHFFNATFPDECHTKMGELSANGAKIVCVAFPPGGGNSWSIVNDKGQFFNRNIPDECHAKMGELSANGAKIVCVAFPHGGGNSWSVVNDKGQFFNRNIPDECHAKMGELSANGAKITCVAFPPAGGNSWSVINDKGAFFNRNVPDECHDRMVEYSGIWGALKFVAFDVTDGNGWSINAAVTNIITDGNQLVTIGDVYANIATALEGKVVGYACSVGKSLSYHAYGKARTAADAPAKAFLSSTKIPVASVSKFVTATAAIRVLAKHHISLDSTIAGHVPGDWHLDPVVAAITFRQLLSHRSGIKDYGNVDQGYESLKTFFTQKVDKTKNTPCQGSAVINPANPINANDHNPCYSNYNFAIFRIMLPLIDGFVDNDPAHRADKLAAAYVKIVQKNVFEPVGVIGEDSKPPASGSQATGYAFSYKFPGTSAGVNWGDCTAQVGAAGWYLAVEDIAKVLASLNNGDERILTKAQFADMEATKCGWDATVDATNHRWVEKNGGWGSNGTTISTSVAILGKPGVIGVLFMNSDVSGGGDAAGVLHDAYMKALRPQV